MCMISWYIVTVIILLWRLKGQEFIIGLGLHFFFPDIEEPVFTACPNDFIVYTPEGELLADITWDVQATDNDPTAATSIVCDLEQGVMPEGDYAVECTASDPQGNTQTCFFEISVRG